MKKVLIVLVVLSVMGGGVAFGQVSDTAQLVLTGTVGDFVSIDITALAAASNLNLNTAQTNLDVATATEVSNVIYNVSASTVNNFQFTNGASEFHPYSLTYGGQAVPTNGDPIFGANQGATAGQSRTVAVTYSAASGITGGTYTDTITFTIESQ